MTTTDDLGKSKPRRHSDKQILQRREKILLLMSRGYNQSDIAEELKTTRHTVMRDMKHINVMTRRGLYDLAKQTLPTMYYNCIIGINEIAKEAWKLYNNPDNDPDVNHWHKVAALRLLVEINRSKFKMFEDGPAFMQIGQLQGEMEKIKKDYLLKNDNNFRPFIKETYEESKRLRDLSLSSSSSGDSKAKELVNGEGKHYRIKEIDCSSQELEKEDEDSDKEKADHEDE